MSSQYGKLRPTSGWNLLASLGHPSKFHRVSHLGFVTAATSFTKGQPNFARCLAIFWAGTLYIYIFGGSWPLTEFRHVQNSLCIQVLLSPVLAALLQGTPAAGSAKLCGMVQGMELRNFCRKRHPYSAGRPSRWASAHILDASIFQFTKQWPKHNFSSDVVTTFYIWLQNWQCLEAIHSFILFIFILDNNYATVIL